MMYLPDYCTLVLGRPPRVLLTKDSLPMLPGIDKQTAMPTKMELHSDSFQEQRIMHNDSALYQSEQST